MFSYVNIFTIARLNSITVQIWLVLGASSITSFMLTQSGFSNAGLTIQRTPRCIETITRKLIMSAPRARGVQNRFRAFSSTEHNILQYAHKQQQQHSNCSNKRTVPQPKLPITMEVWYKLDDHEASSLMFEGNHVDHLKRAIKEDWGDRLHAAPAELKVYAPSKGTDIEKSLASNKKVSECRASSYDEPFIVKAPPKQPQQPNGKLRCCSWLISHCCILLCRWNTEMLGSWNTRIRMIRFVYFIEGEER